MTTPLIDIRPDHWAIVAEILLRHVPTCEVRAFGSRVTWTAKEYSDLDLAIVTTQPLDHLRMADIREAFEESDLSFKVDVLDWAVISKAFQKIIDKKYVVIQKGKRNTGVAGGWRTVTLQNAPLEIIDGDRGSNYPTQSEFSTRGHCLFLNAGNVTTRGFDFSDCAFITRGKDALLRKGKLARNDVVLTTRGTVGNSAYFDDSVPFDDIRINSGMVVLRAKQPDLDPRYLYLFIRSGLFHSQVAALRTGSAQPQLPIRDINRIVIPLPSLPEQHAIANILGTLDDKIELNRRMRETLEAMARALFKSWFVDFDPVQTKDLRRGEPMCSPSKRAGTQACPYMTPAILDLFPDSFEDSELGEIPTGWEVPQLADLLIESNQRMGSFHAPEYSSTNDGLQLRSERFNKTLAISPAKNKLIHRGYLVFGLSRKVLNFGLMRDELGSVSSAYKVFKVREEILGSDLLERLMRFKATYFYMAVSASSREGQSVSSEGLGLLRVVVPPRGIQNAFYSFDTRFTERIAAMEVESRTLAALRDALLPKLISGELRVRDAERFVKGAV